MKKPDTCSGCALYYKGFGYGPAVGPVNAKILLVGEALGVQEAILGKPFVGQAGAMLDRILRLCGFSRDQFRIDNTIRCQPPNNWLSGAPWEHEAVEHCSQYIGETLNEKHTVVMPLGAVAARRLLGLAPGRGKMQDLHGTVTRDAQDRFWIVPTFHPSYIQRGAHNIIGVAIHDFKLAAEIALKGRIPDPGKITVDPSIQWFGTWADEAFRYASKVIASGGIPPWLSIDIETPEKARGVDEDELTIGKSSVIDLGDLPTLGDIEKPKALKDKRNVILRVNFAYDKDHGITVPFYGGYTDIIRQLCATPLFSKAFWNIAYDRPRLEINECPVGEPAHDFMDAWHMLQSDVPRGLGFVAPFYSQWGPWKHLSDEKPGEYAAIDAIQTTRIAYGVEADLKKLGMWDTYYRHMYKLDVLALKPAEEVGLLVDPGDREKEEGGLSGFRKLLTDTKEEIVEKIRTHVPEILRPIEKVYKTRRAITDENDQLLPELAPRLEEFNETEIQNQCSKCEKIGVRAGHASVKKCFGATITMLEVDVPRWRLWGEFNPSSAQQMLVYIKHKGHAPGKNKKTKADSSDAAALEALAKRHKSDPVYPLCLDLRKVDKMKGTYADGMLKRMDENNRVHTTFTHKPSTLRLSSGDPNLQNLVKRGDDETAYAKKFRECVIAGPGNVLIEADYAGIEAVEVGWFSGDPSYIRLATIGVHSFLCSHLLNNPADLSWDDQKLGEFLSQFKKSKDPKVKELYARSKRCVHGCLGPDHEVLTPMGWVRLDQYSEGTPVAQWDAGKLSFVIPSKLTRVPNQNPNMLKLHGRSLSAVMTLDHRLPFKYSYEDAWREVTASTLPNQGRIPTSGVLEGIEEIDHDFLRLVVATQADAAIGGDGRFGIVFHLTKSRKITRLEEILGRLHIGYSKVSCACHDAGVRIRIGTECANLVLAWLDGKEKTFNLSAFLRLSKTCREVVVEELPLWDGHRVEKKRYVYFTTNRRQADIVQTLATTIGKQALLRIAIKGEGHYGDKDCYSVSMNVRKGAAVDRLDRSEIPYTGFVYCLTVPSSYFMIKHDDRISITGNTNYGMTPPGMHANYPDTFKTVKDASKVQDLYMAVCPKLHEWQKSLIQRAHRYGYLGGDEHPFKYRHWFWNVINHKRITRPQFLAARRNGTQVIENESGYWSVQYGEDAKRAIAFFPQSTAGGILKETMLHLFDPEIPDTYIGDVYYGRTPLRMPIHDSLVLEVPSARADFVLERLTKVMSTPVKQQPCPESWGIGQTDGIKIGIEVEMGSNWAEMRAVDIKQYGG